MPDIQARTADGVTHSFPDGTPPEVMDRAIKKYVSDQQPKLQAGALQTRKGGPVYRNADEVVAANRSADREASTLAEKGIAGSVPGGELTIGAVKGALSTGRNIGHLLTKTPLVGKYLGQLDPSMATGEAPEALKPHGITQEVGFGGEQAAEFAIPGGAVERGAKLAGGAIDAARMAPILGKAAKLGSRALLEGAAAGTANASQGGDFSTGAILGGGGEILGAGLRAAAPKLAESALKINERMRGRGRTIGEAVLKETEGLRPATIAREAGGRIGELTDQMEGAVHAATQQGVSGTTQGAHDVLNNALAKTPRNARDLIDKLNSLREVLSLTPVQGGRAPRMTHSPDELLEIKRGIDKTISTWGPEWQRLSDVQRIKQQLYGAIDKELDRLVPGNAEINQQISSLIPAKRQGVRLSDQATLGQRILGRVGAHTGALAGAGVGTALGYQKGGAEGALVGGTLGLAVPEILASPSVQMAGARVLGAKLPPAITRLGKGAVLGSRRASQ